MSSSDPSTTLEKLRTEALILARRTIDPIEKQQLIDLAASYTQAISALHTHGIAIVPPSAAQMAWRSVPMWCSNDR